jgi:uncharacterized membrane protein (UPF0136 family)
MMMMNYVPVLMFVYGFLLLCGGFIGFIQTGSKISFIMGIIAALLSDLAGYGMIKKWVLGTFGALAITLFFTLFFSYRFWLTQKIMPGAVFAVLSLLMFGLLLWYNRLKI